MKVYGALQVAQLEWFDNGSRPAASNYPYRVIWNTTTNKVEVSDGASWISTNPAGISVYDALATYNIGDIVTDGAGKVYYSLTNGNLGNAVSDYTNWRLINIEAQENLAINGTLSFWQRVVSSTTTVNTATTQAFYTADRICTFSGGATVKNYSVVRDTDVPTVTQSGFFCKYSHKFTMITGIGGFAASDYVLPFVYRMEGYDFSNICNSSFSVSFWIKGSVTGTYNVSFRNGGLDRSYVSTFTINVANTWEYKTVTLSLNIASIGGSWGLEATTGLEISIGHFGGSNYTTASLNTWNSDDNTTATTSTNWMATNNQTLKITNFAITKGPIPYLSGQYRRCGDSYSSELQRCLRYYEKSFEMDTNPSTGVDNSYLVLATNTTTSVANGSTWLVGMHPRFTVEKRGVPTVTLYRPLVATSGSWDELVTVRATSATNVRFKGFNLTNNTGGAVTPSNALFRGQWTADAEI